MTNQEFRVGRPHNIGLIALIADDNELFRTALRSILTRHLGVLEVIENAASFDEAIEKLAERADTSVALFDIQMPGLERAMTLRVVRDNFPEIQVVVVSSWQRRQDVIAALDAGVYGYVPNSLGAADLARTLREVLQGKNFVPPSLAELPPDGKDASDARPPAFSAEKAPASLTPRQQQVLEFLAEGKSNKEIARALGLGEGTVKIHMAALFRNLGVTNRAAAAVVGSRLLRSMKVRNGTRR